MKRIINIKTCVSCLNSSSEEQFYKNIEPRNSTKDEGQYPKAFVERNEIYQMYIWGRVRQNLGYI